MPADAPGPAGPPEPLDLVRARSGLSIDRDGRFLHQGEPVTHARTLEVLWGSLARDGEGRWTVAIGRERAFVEVEDAPYAVLGVLGLPGEPVLCLSGGGREPLDPATLRVGRDGVLHCTVKGSAPARFSRTAQVALGLHLEEDPPGSGDWVVTLGGRARRVPRD